MAHRCPRTGDDHSPSALHRDRRRNRAPSAPRRGARRHPSRHHGCRIGSTRTRETSSSRLTMDGALLQRGAMLLEHADQMRAERGGQDVLGPDLANARAPASSKRQFDFLSTPRRKREGGANVVRFQIGIGVQDLLMSTARGEQSDYGTHGYPHAPNTRPPAHHQRVACDPVEEIQGVTAGELIREVLRLPHRQALAGPPRDRSTSLPGRPESAGVRHGRAGAVRVGA